VDLPEVNQFFESSRPGLHIVGELAGMGLIKNALIQGIEVAAHFRETLPPRTSMDGVDVLIVGAGPAGLATAAGCRAAGLTFEVVEQDTIGGTVAHYPRHKVVMTETVEMPFVHKFGRSRMTKEELLDELDNLRKCADIRVQAGTKVTAIDGQLGDFVVVTTRGIVKARRVVLAIGRRGSPRTLGVPGEDLGNVTYNLVDPTQYDGKHVLVVGGGDSALEAAIALAKESSATVAISYRRPEFGRCRSANREAIASLIQKGRVQALLSTDVQAVVADAVELRTPTGVQHLPSDYVIACLGGELPTEFLRSVRIDIKRHHGTEPVLVNAIKHHAEHKRRGILRQRYLWLLGACVLLALAAFGHRYYLLPRNLRPLAPEHRLLRSSGLVGHSLGICAAGLMVFNFLYVARKRLRLFKRKASIGPWLKLHVLAGLFAFLLISFHSGFGGTNRLANITFVALAVVVATGLAGAHVYGFLRLPPDLDRQIERLTEEIHNTVVHMPSLFHGSHLWGNSPVRQIVTLLQGHLSLSDGLAMNMLRIPVAWVGSVFALARLRWAFLDPRSHLIFARQVLRLRGLRTRAMVHAQFKQVLAWWRLLHVVAAVLLLTLMILHIWVATRLGFGWPHG
jgi:dihydropyrimidine dehydrogenase (NAD+) subunit PreT